MLSEIILFIILISTAKCFGSGKQVEKYRKIPPAVTELDRYFFDLPGNARGYHVVQKPFVQEVDPELRPNKIGRFPRLESFGAKGEWLTLGFVIYATEPLKGVSITSTSLNGNADESISSENIEIRLNRRILQLKEPIRINPQGERAAVAALLDSAHPFDLPNGYFKEVTVTIHVPKSTASGYYAGKLKISTKGRNPYHFPMRVRVFPFILTPSNRKEYGMYYKTDISLENREKLCAELLDLRNHHVKHIYSYIGMKHSRKGTGIITSYEEIEDTLILYRKFGFNGKVIFLAKLRFLASMLGIKDANQKMKGVSLAKNERYFQCVKKAIEGFRNLNEKYPEFELIVTHMDEVLNHKKLQLFINMTKPIRQIPEQRVYITLYNKPEFWASKLIRKLDPYVDLRSYTGCILDLWLQAGHTWEELKQELVESGDEGWMYYNPNRSWYTAQWARNINGLFMWWSPIKVHCPYRYRLMQSYPLPYLHNMGYTVTSQEDGITPIATRNWEGYRLGVQDAWYFCYLEDLSKKDEIKNNRCVQKAKGWLKYLRGLMPSSQELSISMGKINKNNPVLSYMANKINPMQVEKIRFQTAKHILALNEALSSLRN